MPLVIRDRVKETTTTAGTGTITLAGAASGFQSFSAIGNGNSTYYVITDPATGDWEVGIGTYTSSGTTLSRTTVLSSSNSGSLVTFAAGVKDVFVSYPSSRAVYQNEAGTQTVQAAFGAITATSAALTTGTITTAPVNNTDIVNKQYADAIASGIHFHEAVELATTAALPANTYNNGTGGVGATLTANANGALSVDSTLTVVGNRILVKNQAAGLQNGVYVVTQVGSAGAPYILTRATDFDSVGSGVNQIDEGDFFLVTSGTVNVNTAWVQQTPPPITVGTTAIVFQQFSAPITYTAGTGLSESPTYTFNIANIGTAGTYGSASSVPVFTTNAQGQVTSVTNTAIAINGSAVTGNITGQAGSVANALTAGTFLTSGGTYNGSAARTFAVDATDANTASKVVARDASGNFSAGTITAALSGNATSATNVAGGAANRIVFNTGSGATSFVAAPTASGEVLGWNGSAFAYTTTIATATNVTGTVAVANGGTGSITLTANNVLLGNGTGALQVVAPGSSGNVLTSNGTTWTSAAAGAALSGVTQSATPFETALGFEAGLNTTGVNNTFTGYRAGRANTTGTDNTAVGYTTGDGITTGNQNVLLGSGAGSSGTNDLTTGSNNILIGFNAAATSATVSNEATVGNSSVSTFRVPGVNYSLTSSKFTWGSGANMVATSGIAIGVLANQTASGADNICIGSMAGRAESGDSGGGNIFIGNFAGLYSGGGPSPNNVGVGGSALQSISAGGTNTAVGFESGDQITTGIRNVTLGAGAASSGTNDLTTGSNNILIGFNAAATSATVSNETTIGNSNTTSARIFGDLKFLKSYTETVFAVSGTTPALSPLNGTIQTWTLSGNSTPTAGTWADGQSITLMVDDGTANTITWTSIPVTWKTDSGAAPTLNTTGVTAIVLWEVGSVIYGARVGNA